MNDPATRRFENSEREVASPAPEAPPAFYLLVVSGGPSGQMFRVEPGGTRIGRALDNEVAFSEDSLSRYHAFLSVDGAEESWLNDLGSTNGTFRNGERIPRQTPVRIRVGDQLRFGLSMLVKFVRLSPVEEEFHRRLFERGARDSLTGLNNRASFLEQLGPFAGRGALQGLGLGVLMLDVDHFKRVNDTFGHNAGDEVLKAVAETIRQSLRPDDLVGRFGGEEFVVAMVVPDEFRGALIGERIRRNLAARVLEVAGQPLRVTASLGLAFAPHDSQRSLNALITAADVLLYAAKKAGRDRLICESAAGAGGGGPEPEATAS